MTIEERINIKTPEYVSLKFRLAGLGSRAAAMIIDQIIITVANVIVFLLFLYSASSSMFWFTDSIWPIAVAIIIIFIINWGYFFIAEYFYNGKTIGKHLIGIRVIQENGHNITLLSCFIRNLLRIVDMLPTSYFLGIVMVFFHAKHKRLGDLAAGTIVVHERSKKKRKASSIEKYIERRGLSKSTISIDDWTIQSLGKKEWDLLQGYSEKLLELDISQRRDLTRKLAAILFPKVGMKLDNQTVKELEDALLVLYLYMKEEWEYEL
ncbi:RDD family protein [Ornithinibacillus halophilus]|uniref:Uncharacterized membrane protein YckC, RDD family n=1 Tax=Ornithinibacillus halophilus TaxID=930117 RepID=A0A1M5G8G2_9BACI|nr:RDD family protein [Ornithinibacillus halophilus]SHG00019.1 Uncharacterized membrane protein YckC, RDD family [Ornithinibacillus halophilus]